VLEVLERVAAGPRIGSLWLVPRCCQSAYAGKRGRQSYEIKTK